jgi:Zn-dependent protease
VTTSTEPSSGGSPRTCARCGTELARSARACPSCHALVYGDRLRDLAARATAFAGDGALEYARDAWQESLDLLPPDSQQYATITTKIAELESRLAGAAAPATATKRAKTEGGSWWAQGLAGAGAVLFLLLGKGKFLLLGLTKLKTFVSMFAFFGVYWTAFGWPLALGFVVGIYIHEMGHVAMLKRLGIGASAPFFIPGVGAFILAKQHITDPRQDAAVGLAGPIWGLGAGIAAYVVYLVTKIPIWLAITQVTGLINLFNLLPVWQLDGARGFHALNAAMRWWIVVALGAAFWLSGVKILVVIAGFAAWQAWRREEGPGDTRTFVTFLALIAALSWMSALPAMRAMQS